jgi:hypothetical protein
MLTGRTKQKKPIADFQDRLIGGIADFIYEVSGKSKRK